MKVEIGLIKSLLRVVAFFLHLLFKHIFLEHVLNPLSTFNTELAVLLRHLVKTHEGFQVIYALIPFLLNDWLSGFSVATCLAVLKDPWNFLLFFS